MKIKFSEQTKEYILAFCISGMILITFWFILNHFSNVLQVFRIFTATIFPFVLGIGIWFILVPLRRYIEGKLLKNIKFQFKTKRKIAVLGCIVVLFLALALFSLILIPQLYLSIQRLIRTLDTYVPTLDMFFRKYDSNISMLMIEVLENVKKYFLDILIGTGSFFTTVISYSFIVFRSIIDTFIGLIIAIYILLDEERFRKQMRKIILAFCNHKPAQFILKVSKLSGQMFSNFIYGKALDSFIIGIICYICVELMHMPYPPLIAFVVGVTNMIPVFGPFIGAIPCIFIIFITSPIKALEFAGFILLLQQIDGNVIGPKILGDSMGLHAFWVMFAIIIGGALFGIVGMFLAVPIFSVIYIIIKEITEKKLKEKDIII